MSVRRPLPQSPSQVPNPINENSVNAPGPEASTLRLKAPSLPTLHPPSSARGGSNLNPRAAPLLASEALATRFANPQSPQGGAPAQASTPPDPRCLRVPGPRASPLRFIPCPKRENLFWGVLLFICGWMLAAASCWIRRHFLKFFFVFPLAGLLLRSWLASTWGIWIRAPPRARSRTSSACLGFSRGEMPVTLFNNSEASSTVHALAYFHEFGVI